MKRGGYPGGQYNPMNSNGRGSWGGGPQQQNQNRNRNYFPPPMNPNPSRPPNHNRTTQNNMNNAQRNGGMIKKQCIEFDKNVSLIEAFIKGAKLPPYNGEQGMDDEVRVVKAMCRCLDLLLISQVYKQKYQLFIKCLQRLKTQCDEFTLLSLDNIRPLFTKARNLMQNIFKKTGKLFGSDAIYTHLIFLFINTLVEHLHLSEELGFLKKNGLLALNIRQNIYGNIGKKVSDYYESNIKKEILGDGESSAFLLFYLLEYAKLTKNGKTGELLKMFFRVFDLAEDDVCAASAAYNLLIGAVGKDAAANFLMSNYGDVFKKVLSHNRESQKMEQTKQTNTRQPPLSQPPIMRSHPISSMGGNPFFNPNHETNNQNRATFTAFSAIKEGKFKDALDILQTENVNLTATDQEGNSLLHFCVQFDNSDAVDVINYLFGRYVNIGLTNYRGQTAMDLAATEEIKDILLEGLMKNSDMRFDL